MPAGARRRLARLGGYLERTETSGHEEESPGRTHVRGPELEVVLPRSAGSSGLRGLSSQSIGSLGLVASEQGGLSHRSVGSESGSRELGSIPSVVDGEMGGLSPRLVGSEFGSSEVGLWPFGVVGDPGGLSPRSVGSVPSVVAVELGRLSPRSSRSGSLPSVGASEQGWLSPRSGTFGYPPSVSASSLGRLSPRSSMSGSLPSVSVSALGRPSPRSVGSEPSVSSLSGSLPSVGTSATGRLSPRAAGREPRSGEVGPREAPGGSSGLGVPPDVAHVAWAVALDHPLRSSVGALPESLRSVVEWLRGTPALEVARFRARELARIHAVAQSLPVGVRAPGSVNVELFQLLLKESGFSDLGAAECCRGALLHGAMDGPEEWPLVDDDPGLAWSVEDVLRANACDRAKFLTSVRPSPYDQALWDSSVADVTSGKMAGPFWSLAEVAAEVGPEFAISRRFPVVQGDKVRPCDDLLRSYVNRSAWRKRKLKLPGVDDFCNLAECVRSYAAPWFWKVDHEAAYRQIPLQASERRLAVVTFCDPSSGQKCLWIHNALPFGALGAVYGYNRPARGLVHIARVLLRIPVDNYFDDYWGVEGGASVASGFEAFKVLNELLGFLLKPSKERSPGKEGEVLGLEVELSSPQTRVSVSMARRAKLLQAIAGILFGGRLLPGSAGSLVGKLGFACSGIFGRVGRAALQPLYRRQHARRGSTALSRPLRSALGFFVTLLEDPPPRVFHSPSAARPPVVIYTDGNGAGCLGIVLFERGEAPEVRFCAVPPAVLGLLQVRKQQIALIELIAVVVAFEVFADAVRDRDVLLFVDNRVAEGVVRNGYARRVAQDASALANLLWLRCAALKVCLYVRWVESDSNIADGPSRPNEPAKSAGLRSLGSRWEEVAPFPPTVARALKEDLGWPLAL